MRRWSVLWLPAELAHQWARKLQARRHGTVSVL
jgi:hypothetical protein